MVGTIKKPSGMLMYLAGETPLSKVDGWKAKGIDIQDKLESVIRRRLFSYFYHNDKGGKLSDEVQHSIDLGYDLFLDSGAFSAHTKGVHISIDEYAQFINTYGHHYTVRANLDDIGDDGPKSWENLKALESNGCDVFPVFHAQDKEEYMVKILDGGYKYMALGGLVGTSVKALNEWLDRIWSNYLINPDGTARIRVHGFGMTSYPLIHKYPWASVDSSSAVQKSMYGMCAVILNDKFYSIGFSNESNMREQVGGWHYQRMPVEMRKAVDAYIEPLGVTPEQLAEDYAYRHIVNFYTYQHIEDEHYTTHFKHVQETFF